MRKEIITIFILHYILAAMCLRRSCQAESEKQNVPL